MKVPLLDLKEQYRSLKKEILAATEAVYESQHFILGERVTSLEESIALYCGTSHFFTNNKYAKQYYCYIIF